MRSESSYGRARGNFERASRTAFKTLERQRGAAAVEALAVVESAAEDVRAALVDELRAAGGSWADVGELLGISRQAAWKRFGS